TDRRRTGYQRDHREGPARPRDAQDGRRLRAGPRTNGRALGNTTYGVTSAAAPNVTAADAALTLSGSVSLSGPPWGAVRPLPSRPRTRLRRGTGLRSLRRRGRKGRRGRRSRRSLPR